MSESNPYVGRLSPDRRWRWDGQGWIPAAQAALPAWAAVRHRVALNRRGLVVIALAAIAGDQALRSGAFGLACTAAISIVAGGLLLTRLLSNRQAIVMSVLG